MSIVSFWTGASGMRAFQRGLDVTAHNIANVGTNGYKYRRASFQDLLYNRINTNVEGNHLAGNGVKQEYIDQIMTQAGLDHTLYNLDFALVGDGFFRVDNGGQIEYTRNGAFDLSMEAAGPTLVTNDGAYVLDAGGNRIVLPEGEDGNYSTDGLLARLAVYRFPNQWGLNPENNARYTESANSGAPVLTPPAGLDTQNPLEVLQGYLEFSGVDLGNEVINIIMYQRAYQVSSRVLQTADQIADELNNLR